MSGRCNVVSAGCSTVIGMGSLAAAMGIGRFAATPLLPLMQQAFGLTLTQGAWLASANYLGYLAGAAAAFVANPPAGIAARWGLLLVAASTAAMGLTAAFEYWLVLRWMSGVGSAFVLVGASSWALAHLAAARSPRSSGAVFAGVGVGIVVAGLVALGAAIADADPDGAWLLLGVLCAGVAVFTWRPMAIPAAAVEAQEARSPVPLAPSEWTLVACYATFGFGYVIPATFISAAARELAEDPRVFGCVWPLFGLAAAASTLTVSTLLRSAPPRRVAAWSLIVMAVGVVAPVVAPGMAALVVSALCVGSTFMVTTMSGAQEARRIASGSPTRLIAALTAAFAVGQFAGPVVIGVGRGSATAVAMTSAAASVLLLLSAWALARRRAGQRASTPQETGEV